MEVNCLPLKAYLWAFSGVILSAYLDHEYTTFCLKKNIPVSKSFCYVDAVKIIVFPGKCH